MFYIQIEIYLQYYIYTIFTELLLISLFTNFIKAILNEQVFINLN